MRMLHTTRYIPILRSDDVLVKNKPKRKIQNASVICIFQLKMSNILFKFTRLLLFCTTNNIKLTRSVKGAKKSPVNAQRNRIAQ